MIDLVIEKAKEIAKTFEGFSSKPYLCPAGVWTIGYGTTRYPDGRTATKDDLPITVEQAEIYLEYELIKCAKGAVKYCPILAKYPMKWAAITDFCYNLGVGRLQYSTLRKRINEENWEEAKNELMRWVYAGGKKLSGLIKRRYIESELL